MKLGPDGRLWHGDESTMSNWYGYGADVLAVSDGIIVAAKDGLAERVPGEDAGNYIALDIGAGQYAFYEHLQPGSLRVRLGQHVHAGQLLAALGRSGSVSSGPHLHFHIADANSPLRAEGLPFTLRDFQQIGIFESLESLGRPWMPASTQSPINRNMQFPPALSVIDFND